MLSKKKSSVHANIFEPQRSTVFPVQPLLTVCEPTSNTARTLWTVRAVEEGYVLISDVSEPMYLALIFEQS
jgi:hypothetical protein